MIAAPTSPLDVAPLVSAVDSLLTHAVEVLEDHTTDASAIALLCSQDALREMIQDCLQSKAGSWHELVLATRTLDRTIALMAAISAEVDAGPTRHSRRGMFGGAIYSGAVLLPRILGRLEECAATFGRKRPQFYSSGAVVSLVKSGSLTPSELYSDGLRDSAYRQGVLAGVGGDCFDLLDDIGRHRGPSHVTPLFRSAAILSRWQTHFAKYGISVTRRHEWGAGRMLSASDVASMWGTTEARVTDARRKRRILGVPMWDGSTVFPQIQFDGATGMPIAGLSDLLRTTNFEAVSPWSLAIWLGREVSPGTKRIHTLPDEDARKEVCADLWAVGAANGVDPVANQPSVEAFEELIGRGSAGPSKLFRVSRIGFSPFFFGAADGQAASSRFDLNMPHGTLYTATRREGAFNEVFFRMLIVDVQEILSRVLWKFELATTTKPLLNLTARGYERTKIGRVQTIIMSRNRPSTQQVAQNAHTAGYRGILHPLHSDNGYVGVAIFGLAGPRSPEACGLGLWSASHDRLATSREFWNWFRQNLEKQSFEALYNQLPLVPLF